MKHCFQCVSQLCAARRINNSRPRSSDLLGKCSFWPCCSLFFPLLLNLFTCVFIPFSFGCPACYSFALGPCTLSCLLVSQLLLCVASSFLWLYWISLLDFLATHLPILAILCSLPAAPVATFRILQCICPNLHYSVWTASLIFMLPGHH